MEDVPVFSLTDYIVMGLMLCVSSGIGIFFAVRDRRDQSNKTFLLGNRQLGVFPVAMSLMASFQSATTVLGYPAEMYYKGTQFWMAIFGLALSNVIAAELFMPVLYNLQLTSVNSHVFALWD
ncbi:sodium/solute symporter, putative [Ixodes scapularis]|uniref:Sodium/solute symporter, putative n=1 Tax=Ixodes scapularis TaxID=6945 RepID=B7PLJ3_IXOSC|nr:sodium/solute symporter, putative [Ixodes scapularis]|eukprot:XP_002434641.1 sodium/solute symporter, putative [Ixodes scapularis]